MVKIKKEVVIDIGPESGLGIMDIYRTNANIISAIIDLDTSIADWNFTIDLICAIVGMVSDDDRILDEFVCENIDDTNYQELYKKVKRLYKAMKKGIKNG